MIKKQGYKKIITTKNKIITGTRLADDVIAIFFEDSVWVYGNENKLTKYKHWEIPINDTRPD